MSELGPGQLNNGLQLLACRVCVRDVCDSGACVCTCVCCLSSGIGFGVDPGPALPLHAVCIDRRQTPGRSPRSRGLRTLETHTSAEQDVHTSTHTHTYKNAQTHLFGMCMKTEHTQAYTCNLPPTQTLLTHPSNSLQLYSSPSALHHQPLEGI